jgi:hypothetical protein
VITDRRTTVGHRRYVLDEIEARIYLGCDAGAEPDALAADVSRSLGRDLEAAGVRATLHDLAEEHLVYEEDGHYLSLAIPEGSAALVMPGH